MGKLARRQSPARISRSGLWLIGGMLALSAAVLAWALQGDTTSGSRNVAPPGRRAHPSIRPPGTPRVGDSEATGAARSGSNRDPAATDPPAAPAAGGAERPASASDYGPLLQGNVFQPRVVVIHEGGGHGRAPQSKIQTPRGHPKSKIGTPAAPAITDGWNDWKFTGVAQLDQQTYALVDQPEKKQSRFVKVGDPLEDATVVQVAENEITLRQADGSLIRVKRVDPAADALRAVAPAAPGAAPTTPGGAPAGAAPAASPFGAGPATNFPSPQAPSPSPPADSGGFGRGGRRFQQQDGGGLQ